MPNPTGAPPSGTRDFFGDELRSRERSIAAVERVFELFGFEPLETPAFERLDVLMGKYGEEEKLIFKIAKRGEKRAGGDADLALRYDLTVPLTRYLANRDFQREGVFKRYQIGPVWRADRPARGRFREFFQCDVDIVGADSRLADAEVILAATECLRELGLGRFVVRLNSRAGLTALMAAYAVPTPLHGQAIVALDKLDKLGVEAVARELREREVPEASVREFEADQHAADPKQRVIERLASSPEGERALADVNEVHALVAAQIRGGEIAFDPFIARGLDYYTGPVFEIGYVEDPDALPLSIASGGRYDGLVRGREPVPATGASLGLERILLLLADAKSEQAPPLVLVTVWSEETKATALELAMALRSQGVRADTYQGSGSLKAQLRFAARRGARVCVIAGPDEIARGEASVRDLDSGDQRSGPRSEVVSLVRGLLE